MAVTNRDAALGEALRTLRKTAGLTLADLTREAGISGPYLSNVENGRLSPSPEWIKALLISIGEQIDAGKKAA